MFKPVDCAGEIALLPGIDNGLRGLGLVFEGLDQVPDGFREAIGGVFFLALRLVVVTCAVKRRIEIMVSDCGPVHQVTEKIAQTLFMVTARLLAEGEDGLVGPVGAVEIRNHVIPFPSWEAATMGPRKGPASGGGRWDQETDR
jgi:hypothetical protein